MLFKSAEICSNLALSLAPPSGNLTVLQDKVNIKAECINATNLRVIQHTACFFIQGFKFGCIHIF